MNENNIPAANSLFKEKLLQKLGQLIHQFNSLDTPIKRSIEIVISQPTPKVPAYYILAKRMALENSRKVHENEPAAQDEPDHPIIVS